MAIIDKIQLSGTVYTIGNETTTAVTSASTDNEIPTAKAVYDAIPQGGGGGGKAIEAGTNISITTGETADTINCTLPIRTDGNYSGKGIILGKGNNMAAKGAISIVGGSFVSASTNAHYSVGFGNFINLSNEAEFSCGEFSKTNRANSTFGDSGNTLFSVGNGTSESARHNAFEIRQNGDIYITKDGQDVKLQDQLGGGGSSYTAGDGIDINNDVISVTGKVDTSAFTAHTADTVIHVTSAEKSAWNDKQDALVSGTNIKTINGETLLGEGNITIQGGSGGGKAVSAGTNISVTTGETADTINCTLNLENGTNSESGGIKLKSNAAGNEVRGRDACAFGGGNKANGTNSFVTGYYNTGNTSSSFISGYKNQTTNNMEVLFGMLALSNGSQSSDLNGNSGCTLFAVGNGEWRKQLKHNAFEIRQNGDIYIADTNDTSTTNYYEKPMIKLQDALGGGGGSSYTAGDGIDITNDVISVTGKVDTSAITTSVTSSSTDSQVPSAKSVYDNFDGLKLKKITQSAYDALSPNYDANTLYVING